MAEGFEAYHVPQQSRREKLRAATELHHLPSPPPYDHHHLIGSSPSDLLTCYPKQDETLTSMAVLGSPSSSSLRIPYGTAFDPSLLYGDDHVAALKPEPLSLSLGVSRGSAPLGPFTGYASVLKGSRFLRPAQQLLEELCRDLVGVLSPPESNNDLSPDSSLMVMEGNAIFDDDDRDHDHGDDDDDDDDDDYGHDRKKKSRLITMLDEVYRKYTQFYQQMQAVITSFEYVAGLGNAAPYASLAVKAMTRNFRCLKDAIMEQLQYNDRRKHEPTTTALRSGQRTTVMSHHNHNNYHQHQHRASGFLGHNQNHSHIWRPQRGLPERAVTVLRTWLFEHFLHPYPTDTQKMMLAKRTGLSRSQVSNWFINARVRLWKPMVEEIHMLETRQAQKGETKNDDSVPSTSSSSKRSRGNYGDLPRAVGQPSAPVAHNVISPYDGGLAGQLHAGPTAGGGVSLTLGLHQVGGLAQRFGIDGTSSGESYMASFGATTHQSRHFGGQLFHDFVG